MDIHCSPVSLGGFVFNIQLFCHFYGDFICCAIEFHGKELEHQLALKRTEHRETKTKLACLSMAGQNSKNFKLIHMKSNLRADLVLATGRNCVIKLSACRELATVKATHCHRHTHTQREYGCTRFLFIYGMAVYPFRLIGNGNSQSMANAITIMPNSNSRTMIVVVVVVNMSGGILQWQLQISSYVDRVSPSFLGFGECSCS